MAKLLALLFSLAAAAGPASAAEAPAGTGGWLAPGEPLTREIAAGLVQAALQERGGADERFEVEIDSPPLPLPNRAGRPAELALDGLRHEPGSGRLAAALRVRLDTGEASVIEIAGRVRRTVEVTVPAWAIPRGAVIGEADLERRWLPSGALHADSARDPAELVGREARRALAAGRVVRAGDLAAPRLVARGEAVTMVYARGGLEVNALGRALDHGSVGAVVRVANATSDLVREGVVVGPKRVRINAEAAESVP